MIEEYQCFFCKTMTENPKDHHCVPDNPDGYEFFVDCKLYKDPRPSISVADIMNMHNANPIYACFQENRNGPDTPLGPPNSIDLRTRPRIYFVPPATGG